MKFDYYFATLRAALRKDDAEVCRIAGLAAADCEKAGHRDSARRVRQLAESLGAVNSFRALPVEVSKWLWWEVSDTKLDSVRLSEENRQAVDSLIREFSFADALMREGFRPSHRLLLDGPSGTGKTKLARALAHSLSVPFAMIRGGSITDSHMNQTGKNLDQLFGTLQNPCVLCFDEFDQIASTRGNESSSANKDRINSVCVLLTLLERLPPAVVLVATTNRPDAIDDAFLRRFDDRLTLEHPNADQLATFATDLCKRWHHLKLEPAELDLGHSYATAEAAVFSQARSAIIALAMQTKA